MPSTADVAPCSTTIQTMLSALLPDAVILRVGGLGATGLGPAQAKARRPAEFAAGRRLASEALTAAGVARSDVRIGTRGMPLWPPGLTGSITHTREICAVALVELGAVRAIGIDIEATNEVDAGLAELIMRPDEDPTAAPLGWFFSAKESVFKCQYPLTGEDAEFTDCRIIWQSEGRFRVEVDDERFAVCRSFQGAAAQIGPYVVSCAWLP